MPGYKVTPVEAVKEGVVCPHCDLILREAIQTTEEGHRLCESCYKEISSKPDRTCQECGISLGATEQVYPDRAVRRVIHELLVKCDYHGNGCPWKGQLKHLEDHCRECRFQPIKCPNEGCTELLIPDWMDKHVDGECQYRRVKCEHCQEEEVAMKMEDHYATCPKYDIVCGRCEKQVCREELEDHRLHSCSYVECAVADCAEVMVRHPSNTTTAHETTQEHLADPEITFHHMQSLALVVRSNSKELAKLQKHFPGQFEAVSVDMLHREVEKAVKKLDNRIALVQRMAEKVPEPEKKADNQVAVKEHNDRILQLEHKLKNLQSQPAKSSFGSWDSRFTESRTSDVYESAGLENRMVQLEKKMEELERQNAMMKVHISELELQLQASLASTHNGTFLWRIPDVSRRRRDTQITSFYSPLLGHQESDQLLGPECVYPHSRMVAEHGGRMGGQMELVSGHISLRPVTHDNRIELRHRAQLSQAQQLVNTSLHWGRVSLASTHISELELQLQASLASTHNGTFVWQIPDVSRRRRDAIDERITSIYSPPFYTGSNGYKMCIRAYLNGDGIGCKTHLSLFFVLMKGEYDPLLKWPFEYKVSLILVDQNHRKHVVQTFKPTPESSSFQRPRSDMNVASGFPKFTKLSVLDDDNYVRDDIMYVNCIVDTS